MLPYAQSVKEQALLLRSKGFSHREIGVDLCIAPSTAALWTRHLVLNQEAKNRIMYLRNVGREKSSNVLRLRRLHRQKVIQRNIADRFSHFKLTRTTAQLLCSFLYWAEGGKGKSVLQFVNSDPKMIKMFLFLFRKAFQLDESKFRVGVHLHEYHNREQIEKFWSEITNIPLAQFHRPYLKSHTKKVIRENYKGCIRVSYHDVVVFNKLTATYAYMVGWIFPDPDVEYQ